MLLVTNVILESTGVHPTFANTQVIPTQVGIHSRARCSQWIPVCTGMTNSLAIKTMNLQIRDAPNQLPVLKCGGGEVPTQLICGYLQYDQLIFNPLLKNLPVLMHVKSFAAPATPLLETGVRYIIQETTNIQPGSLCLLTRFVELMFVEILRTYMRCLPETQMGWLTALNDPMIGQVLNWLHAEPTYPWTVTELARRSKLSRSALAYRFTQLLGQPPMQYLAQWRLQLASSYLQNTNEGLAKH